MMHSTTTSIHSRDQALSLFTPNSDNTGTELIRVNERALQRTTKCGSNCVTCPFINTDPVIISNATGTAYGIANNAVHDCNTKGVIYLIECRKCHYQYVGLTKQKLKQRLGGHRHALKSGGKTLLYQHLSKDDHTVADLTIRVIQKVGTEKQILHEVEDFWIKVLNSAFPLGLNEKVRGCKDLVSARQYDGNSGTPYLQNKGPRRPRPRGRTRPFRDTPSIDEATEHTRILLKNKRLYHVLYYLRTLQQPVLRKLRHSITRDHSQMHRLNRVGVNYGCVRTAAGCKMKKRKCLTNRQPRPNVKENQKVSTQSTNSTRRRTLRSRNVF